MVALHFKTTERTIYRWERAGMPVLPDGRYDLVQITVWKMGRKGSGRPDPAAEDQEEEGGKAFWTRREIQARAELKELALKERRAELVELQEVEQLFVARIVAVTQGLESLARALPPLLVNRSEREMEPIIARRTRALRELFARPLPEKFGSSAEKEADHA